MQKLYDTVLNAEGQPVQGAMVSVYETGTSTLSALYEDDGVTGKANPLTADAYGLIQALVDDGTYDVVVAYGTESKRINKITFGSGFDAASPGPIGGTTPGAGSFTTLTASTSLQINETVAVTGVLDEDDMASDSATAVPTQQSVKAYVDAATAGGGLPDESYLSIQGTGQTTTSTTFADVTGHQVSVTTANASDEVEIECDIEAGFSTAPTGAGYGWLQIVHVGSGAVVQKIAAMSQTNGVVQYLHPCFKGRHAPGSAGSHTYKLQMARSGSGTFHVANSGSGFNNSISAQVRP